MHFSFQSYFKSELSAQPLDTRCLEGEITLSC